MATGYLELKKEHEMLENHLQSVINITSTLNNLSKFYNFTLVTRSADLSKIENEIRVKISDVEARWKTLKENCKDHNWYYYSRDANNNHYRCSYCGATDWW